MIEEKNTNKPQKPAFLVGAVSGSVIANRRLFLSELRSGKYKKGTIKSDEKGYPIFETEADKEGHCCCAVMVELFGTEKYSLPKAMKALGLKRQDCQFIQQDINDNNSTLFENADRIESEVFKHYC